MPLGVGVITPGTNPGRTYIAEVCGGAIVAYGVMLLIGAPITCRVTICGFACETKAEPDAIIWFGVITCCIICDCGPYTGIDTNGGG